MATQHTLTVHPDQQRALEAIAAEEHCSPDFVLHDAIEQYLTRQGSQSEVVLSAEELEELDSRWEHHQRTGLHVTLEEADAWLSRLQAGEKMPPPKCHV